MAERIPSTKAIPARAITGLLVELRAMTAVTYPPHGAATTATVMLSAIHPVVTTSVVPSLNAAAGFSANKTRGMFTMAAMTANPTKTAATALITFGALQPTIPFVPRPAPSSRPSPPPRAVAGWGVTERDLYQGSTHSDLYPLSSTPVSFSCFSNLAILVKASAPSPIPIIPNDIPIIPKASIPFPPFHRITPTGVIRIRDAEKQRPGAQTPGLLSYSRGY